MAGQTPFRLMEESSSIPTEATHRRPTFFSL